MYRPKETNNNIRMNWQVFFIIMSRLVSRFTNARPSLTSRFDFESILNGKILKKKNVTLGDVATASLKSGILSNEMWKHEDIVNEVLKRGYDLKFGFLAPLVRRGMGMLNAGNKTYQPAGDCTRPLSQAEIKELIEVLVNLNHEKIMIQRYKEAGISAPSSQHSS